MANVAPLLTPDYAGLPRIIDSTGQEVLLRGVEVSDGAGSAVYQKIPATGANFVRVPIYWSKAEPTAPSGSGADWTTYVHTYAASYLTAAETLVQYMQTNHIYVEIFANFTGWSPAAPFNGTGGVPAWFYTDARFPGVTDLSSTANNVNAAIGKWWTRWITDPGNFTADQYFYAQFWTELIRRFSAYNNVVMYGVWHEPTVGTISGTTWQQKDADVHGWLSWVVDQMHAADPQRMKAVGVIGDMLGWGSAGSGSAGFASFGSAEQMQRKHMILDFHEVYSGKAPGYPADATVSGQVGLDTAGDALVGGFAATHTLVTNASYAGSLTYHENLMTVPRATARRLGLPLMLGNMAVYNGDPGRLAYIQHMQQLMDAHAFSGAVLRFNDTGTSTTAVGLLTNGVLNDMGIAWSNWWKATDFTRGVGSGTAGGSGISTVPDTADTTPNYYHSGTTISGRVYDVAELNGVVYVAGAYDTVRDVDGTVLTNVPYLSAYRADTGAVIRTWRPQLDGTVQRIVIGPGGGAIVVFGAFNNAGGVARTSMAAYDALAGPTDASAANLHNNPAVVIDGRIWDAIVDTFNYDVWIVGGFSTVGGVTRRGIAKFNIDPNTSQWTLDTAFNANVPAFIANGGGRAVTIKPDRTKIVVGWFPGGAGTDVGSVPSLTAYNPFTGAAAAWENKAYYTNPADAHVGVTALASDPGGVYVGGLWNGGMSVVYMDWNGSGPNSVSFAAGVAPVTPGAAATTANAFWYWGFDDVVQALALGRVNDSPVVFVGHRGNHVATAANRAATGSDQANAGLATLSQGISNPSLAGYGGPPNFTTPNSGTAPNVDEKVFAIYQTPGPGDLIVGGEFTSVNGSAANSYQRFARFSATTASSGWTVLPSLSDATPVAGQAITVDPGVPPPHTGSPTYQWQRSQTGQSGSWANIVGATGSTYTVDGSGADNNFFLRAAVTVALTAGGSQTAYATSSSAITPPPTSPVLTGSQPTISPSTGLSSNQLLTVTTSPSDWAPSGGLTFTYQWFRQKTDTVVPIGTGATYTTSTLDVGGQIYVMVTAHDSASGLTGQAKSNVVTVGTISGTGSIYFLSDAGSGPDAQQITSLIPSDADLIVYGGDVYPRDTTADYAADISGLLSSAKMALLVQLCGNHDWPNRSCGGGYYAQVAALAQHATFSGTKDYGKITIAGWDFIFLNTNRAAQAVVGDCSETTPIVSDAQVGLDATETAQLNTWLNAAGNQKVVIGHHMRYSPSTTHLDNANLDQMWNALQGKCVAYIHGHAHNYSRQRPRDGSGLVASDTGFSGPGVVDICAGTGGEGNYDPNTTYPAKYVAFFRGSSTAPQYGYLRITPTGTQVTIDAIDEDGTTIFDTVTLTATGGAAPSGGHPSLSTTTPFVGETIQGSTGQWQGSLPMTFAATFERSFDGGSTWEPATGVGATATQTSTTGQTTFPYTVDVADLGAALRMRVSATNNVGATPGASPITQAVITASTGAPTIQTFPAVTPSSPSVGALVAVTNGAWSTDPGDPIIGYTYQWLHFTQAGGYAPIPGANSQTYTVQPTDAGFALACDVTATSAAGGDSLPARSNQTTAVTSTAIFVNEQIDTPDNQTIAFGQPFSVQWEATTNAPGGIVRSQIRLDGGAWIDGTKITDDGRGTTVWQYTFQSLSVGTHVIDTQDIIST